MPFCGYCKPRLNKTDIKRMKEDCKMTIKELFEKAEGGSLTLEEAEKILKDAGAKLVDLAEGGYVSKDKFDNEISTRDNQLNQLNETIKSRDKDLKDLKAQFKEAGTDSDTKLAELEEKLGALQSQYKTDTENYKKQLSEQAYDFAVKEFANTKKFSSKAARRDFERELKNAQLKMDGGIIMGAEDYATKYFAENEDALVKTPEEFTPTPNNAETPKQVKTPTFVAPTSPETQTKHKSLSELMRVKNENPNAVISFD